MRSIATFAAVAFAAVIHAGTLMFDDPHPAFTVPATGTATVCLTGQVTLEPFEKDPVFRIGIAPGVYGLPERLAAFIDPAFARYLEENRFGSTYRGPILDFTLSPRTAVGDYDFGDGLYPPFVYFGFGRYEPPHLGGGLLERESYKVFYAIDVRPVPEPASLAGLLAAVALLRRRRA